MSEKSEHPGKLPTGGGSYVRQKTGKLKQVAQTDEAGARQRPGDPEGGSKTSRKSDGEGN